MADAKVEASSAAPRCKNGARVRKIKEYENIFLHSGGKNLFFFRVAKEFLQQGSLYLQLERLASGTRSQSKPRKLF